ncbi:hypothetical protein QQF64_011628 [Cirrhinus molitorella]|uniref:Uncharacterized protein n=1 Tax=Cirrhinus molitorella TaxID=172907 RepID=A0ABR3M2W9_9TELE
MPVTVSSSAHGIAGVDWWLSVAPLQGYLLSRYWTEARSTSLWKSPEESACSQKETMITDQERRSERACAAERERERDDKLQQTRVGMHQKVSLLSFSQFPHRAARPTESERRFTTGLNQTSTVSLRYLSVTHKGSSAYGAPSIDPIYGSKKRACRH